MSNLPKGDYVNVFKPPFVPGLPTEGTHTPSIPYVPSSDKCWGPKGKWDGKSYQDLDYERQYSQTMSYVQADGP